MAVSAILLLLAVTSQSVVGLLAIWAGLGRGPWFVRVAALAAVLALALLIPAYELVVVFTVQCLVIVPSLLVARRLRARAEGKPASQFTIRDLLLTTAVAAAVFALGANVPREVWTSWGFLGVIPPFAFSDMPSWPPFVVYPILGVVAGCTTLATAGVFLGRGRRWSRILLLALVAVPLVAAVGIVLLELARSEPADPLLAVNIWFASSWSDWWAWLPKVAMCLLLPSVTVALWLVLFRAAVENRTTPASDGPRSHRRVRQVVARTSLGLLGVAMLAPLAWAYYILMTPPPIPNDPLPEPNGYGELLRIVRQLEDVAVPDDAEDLPEAERATAKESRDFSERYRAVLDALHLALDTPCRVLLKYDWTDFDLDAMQGARQTARGLIAEAGVASMMGDEEAAADRCLDTVRLGDACARGGLVFHWLLGSALQSIGLYGVHERIDSMTPSLRRDWIGKASALEAQFESMDACSERDDIWSNHACGWQGRLIHVLTDDHGQSQMWAQAESRRHAHYRLLILELALANYRAEHGAYPPMLADLVPGDLNVLPDDPFSGKPLVYRPTDDGFQLYSVGPNGVDDGGKSEDEFDSEGDDVRLR